MSARVFKSLAALKPLKIQHPARLLDFMRQADDSKLINLAAGIPSDDILPFGDLKKATEKAFRESGKKLFGYHVPEGNEALRELIAARLRKRGAKIKAQDVIITGGCTQALHLMINTWVRPGDVVACESPAYYGMIELLAARGALALPLPVSGSEGIDLDEMKKWLKKWKPTSLIVCSSLSNPSSATIPENQRKAFVETCRKLGIRILEDDIYAELLDKGAPKPLRAFDDGSLVAYVSSFSKSVSPGMRMGVAIPGGSFEAVAELKCQQDIHCSHVSEVILQNLMQGPALDKHLARLRKFYKHRREMVYTALETYFPEGSSVTRPDGGFMLWIDLPKKFNLPKIRKEALRQRVSFANGDVFFISAPSKSHIRINCAKASEEHLVEGLSILGKIFKKASQTS